MKANLSKIFASLLLAFIGATLPTSTLLSSVVGQQTLISQAPTYERPKPTLPPYKKEPPTPPASPAPSKGN